MDYLIVIVTAAMIAAYALIIGRLLAERMTGLAPLLAMESSGELRMNRQESRSQLSRRILFSSG